MVQEFKVLDDELSREKVRVETGGALTKEEKIAVYKALVESDSMLGLNSGRVRPTTQTI